MRIYDRDLTGTPAAESNKTTESGRAGRENGTGAAAQTGDHVQLSSGLGKLSRAISADTAGRNQRVTSLAVLYQNGNYRPDSSATSRAMVAEAISAGER